MPAAVVPAVGEGLGHVTVGDDARVGVGCLLATAHDLLLVGDPLVELLDLGFALVVVGVVGRLVRLERLTLFVGGALGGVLIGGALLEGVIRSSNSLTLADHASTRAWRCSKSLSRSVGSGCVSVGTMPPWDWAR